jgi:GxxExxY protein
MEEYLYKDENYKIVGILFEVHKNLGKGFSEIVYKDAIEYEFQQQNIPYQREKEFSVYYKDTILKHKFYADFVVYDKIILEIKTVD